MASKATSYHIPVLRDQILRLLGSVNFRHGTPRTILDATAGTGGHAAALLEFFPGSHVMCLDRDSESLTVCRSRLAQFAPRVSFKHCSFADALSASSACGPFDVVLADLGLGSHTLDGPGRGFSYMCDAPLDMRFDASPEGVPEPIAKGDNLDVHLNTEGDGSEDSGSAEGHRLTAADILTKWPAWRIRGIFETFGDLSPEVAATLSSAVSAWRGRSGNSRRFRSTLELRYVIELAMQLAKGGGSKQVGSQGIEPRVERRGFSKAGLWLDAKERDRCMGRLSGTRPAYPLEVRAVFQALRIVTNGELEHVAALLEQIPRLISPQGVFLPLAYQPTEDALVKAALCALTRGDKGTALWKHVVPIDDPIRPDTAEVRSNARARSARLRGVQSTPGSADDEWSAAAANSLGLEVRAAVSLVLPRLPSQATDLKAVTPLRAFTDRPRRDDSGGNTSTLRRVS